MAEFSTEQKARRVLYSIRQENGLDRNSINNEVMPNTEAPHVDECFYIDYLGKVEKDGSSGPSGFKSINTLGELLDTFDAEVHDDNWERIRNSEQPSQTALVKVRNCIGWLFSHQRCCQRHYRQEMSIFLDSDIGTKNWGIYKTNLETQFTPGD